MVSIQVAGVIIGSSVLQRYLKQTNLDTEEPHQRAGPVRDIEYHNKEKTLDLARALFRLGAEESNPYRLIQSRPRNCLYRIYGVFYSKEYNIW